ncbi:Endo-1,4-beta-xylanase 5 [Camellia lanceoleosa]|uniref:Endo-1,4-beta-xylanase 5 n=1 Tax=Camellia lanceoleosa TaxID=1840588 RepID=A0ACC0IUA1_9ERIC|nr:Endo-1,4-beta-xylanase 5 [Camellia lanceoleosa]
MKIEENTILLLSLFSPLLSGLVVYALPYDYSATLECLENPHKPQYSGGIVVNPELDDGLKGWTVFGDAKIEHRASKGGNTFVVARHRHESHDSFSQKFQLEKGMFYTFSAWLQVSQGNAKVAAMFKTPSGFEYAGWVVAESGCWSMLKGGFVVNASGPSHLYFENRKSSVKLIAMDDKGNPLANATFSIKQQRPNFPFGCAMNKNILTNTGYQNWFRSRFRVTTFENEMKWYSTEFSRGREDYSVPDAMLRFASTNNIRVRGHNVFWDDPRFQPQWVKSLSSNDLLFAVNKRVNSIVPRYAGKVIAWDVVNENLHFHFFESKLAPNASAIFFNDVHRLDPGATLFLNDYNTIEQSGDMASSPARYLQKILQIRSGGYRGPIAIGLESHFSTPNIPYMRAAIDKLGATGLPIWLTEVDIQGPNQVFVFATFLDQVLREGYSHPSINGIIVWAAWSPEGCYHMCLTDNNFRNLPTGDVVDRLIREWSHSGLSAGTTDSNGHFKTRLFHGDYEVTITHPTMVNSSVTRKFEVAPIKKSQQKSLHVKVSA